MLSPLFAKNNYHFLPNFSIWGEQYICPVVTEVGIDQEKVPASPVFSCSTFNHACLQ